MMFKKMFLYIALIGVCAVIIPPSSIHARGEAARGAFGGALGGATLGGIFGGGRGAAIGAGVGAGVGLISGAAAESNRERYRDDYEYYEEPYYDNENTPYEDYDYID